MKKKVSVKMILFVFLSLLIFTGCSSQANESPEKEVMITITDAKGEVEIPKDPKKIVDLSGNSDILSILGYKVVGTANSDAYNYTKFPSYLEDILEGAAILGYSMQDTFDIEAIMNLEPDMIILSTVQEKVYEQLKDIAPTVMIQLEALNWQDDVKAVGTAFNQADKAENWLDGYNEKALAIGNRIKRAHGEDTTYLAFLASGGQFFVFDGAGFGNILYEDMGLRTPSGMPEQTDISLPVVTYEGLAAIEADVIFAIATDEDLAVLQENAIWNNLSAVKSGHVITLDASPYFNQGYSPIGRELLLDEIAVMIDEAK